MVAGEALCLCLLARGQLLRCVNLLDNGVRVPYSVPMTTERTITEDHQRDVDFVLRLVDKHSKRHNEGCPASQIPLALSTVVQGMVAHHQLKVVRGGRNGTNVYLRRIR